MRAAGLAVLVLGVAGCNQVLGLDEPGPPAVLTDLAPSTGTLDPPFDPAVLTYQLALSVVAQELSLTPQGPERLDVRIADTEIAVGTRSPAIAVPRGTSQIVVEVANGDVATTYTITVDRGARAPALHRLGSPTTAPGGFFGVALAADGDRLAVGALGEEPGTVEDCDGSGPAAPLASSGAVYVYRRTGGEYVLEERLGRPADVHCAQFGSAVALDGDRLVVGDPLELVGGAPVTGAVHVYQWDGARWQLATSLHAPGLPPQARFGTAVAADDGWVLVGAPGTMSSRGTLYAFGGDQLSALQTPPIHADVTPGQVGLAIAMQGDRAAVAAPGDATVGLNTGSIGLYQLDDGLWSLATALYPAAPEVGDFVGLSVALDGDRVAAGAPLAGMRRGELHYFTKTAAWAEQGELAVAAGEPEDLYGNRVALRGELLVTGWCRADADLSGWSENDPVPGATADSGLALIYDAADLSLVGALGRPTPQTDALFGCMSALTGDRLFLGAPGEDGNVGAAYVVE